MPSTQYIEIKRGEVLYWVYSVSLLCDSRILQNVFLKLRISLGLACSYLEILARPY